MDERIEDFTSVGQNVVLLAKSLSNDLFLVATCFDTKLQLTTIRTIPFANIAINAEELRATFTLT